jgi:hypothetical protein
MMAIVVMADTNFGLLRSFEMAGVQFPAAGCC